MAKFIFTIKETAAGWLVEGGRTLGPFISKEQATNLAQGMSDALQRAGEDAVVVLEELPRGSAKQR